MGDIELGGYSGPRSGLKKASALFTKIEVLLRASWRAGLGAVVSSVVGGYRKECLPFWKLYVLDPRLNDGFALWLVSPESQIVFAFMATCVVVVPRVPPHSAGSRLEHLVEE